MAWGYSGNVFKEVTAFQEQTQESESFGFEYQRIGMLPRFQGRADNAKYRIGMCGAKCRTNTQGDLATEDVEHMRLASVSTKMIPAAVRVFTSFDFSIVNTAYYLALAYSATEEEEANDTGRILGYTTPDVVEMYKEYFGRMYSPDSIGISDATTTTQEKDEERMLTTWPNIEQTSDESYADWTLSRFNKSIQEMWQSKEVQNELDQSEKFIRTRLEPRVLPANIDIILTSNPSGTPPNLSWTDNDFMQFNCTFASGG